MPLPKFANDLPLFPEERAREALRILSRGLQMGNLSELNLIGIAPTTWEAHIPGYLVHGGSSTEATRALALTIARHVERGTLEATDDALDAISEAYALVGNFDASNWQTGEVTS